jgi:hypothetical protein
MTNMTFPRRIRIFSRTFLCFLTILAPLNAAPAAQAADDPVFTVENVRVDVTDKDAATAREKAFPQAQQQAFLQLAQKLMTEDEMKRFKAPDDITVGSMIKDYEMSDEHLSSVRYVGTYTFRFKGDAVRAWLGKQNLTYTDVPSKTLLILPFYQWGSRTVLWGNDNPWLAAWTRRGPSNKGLVPLAVPLGDVQDIADIGDKDVFTYDRGSLQHMMGRYNAGEAAIALAAVQWDANTGEGQVPRELNVQIYRTDHNGPEFVTSLKIPSQAGDTLDKLYDRAADAVRAALQHDWKTRTAATPADQAAAGTMKVRIRFAGMQQWVETQKALRHAPGVSDVKVLSLKPDAANVEFAFSGTEDRLRLALAQADITLSTPGVDFASGQALVYDLYLNKYAQGSVH